jgi:phosphatidylinositol-3-phosphatase
VLALVIALLVFGGVSTAQSAPSGGPRPAASASPIPAPVVIAPAFPTSIRHVITVVLESENGASVLQNAPFERYLAEKYAYASDYYAICHPAAPNYLAMTSGASWQCGSDRYTTYSTTNVADLVQGAGLTWGAYMQSMSAPCTTRNSGEYAVRHDPFVYYSDIVDNLSRCDSHVLNLTSWSSAVASGNIPNYAFIVPNVLDDGQDTNATYADTWLQGWLSPLLNDSFASSSVFFIVYDESGDSHAGYDGLRGGEVYFTAVGPEVAAHSIDSINTSQYNLLTTTEWLLGLGSLGRNDNGTTFPPMRSLFPTPPESYNVTGTVYLGPAREPLSGATVVASNGSSGMTNSSGDYSLSLLNGSYNLTASAPGLPPETLPITVAGQNVTQDFLLSAVQFGVSGTVTNLANGAPLPDAEVAILGGNTTYTNRSGGYAFALANGTYTMTVSDTGFISTSVTFALNGAPMSVPVALYPSTVTKYDISGTVRFGGSGSIAVGASVTLSPGGTTEITPANGTFQFQVSDGTYNLTAVKSGFPAHTVSVTVEGASVVQNLVLSPAPEFLVEGTVTANGSGQPLPGAVVRISPSDWQTAGPDGNFSFTLPNGTYTFTVTAPGYLSTTVNVSVDGQSISSGLTVRLAPSTTSAGTVPSATPWPWTGLGVTVVLVAAVCLGLFAALRTRERRRRPPPSGP